MQAIARPSQRATVVLSVVVLHGAGLWGLQSGLLARAVEMVVSANVITNLVELPKPPVEVPPPPKTVSKPVAATSPPAAAPTPQQPSPPPLPLAVADAPAAPNAPTGTVTPHAALAPVATPAAPVAAPAPQPKVDLPSSDAEYLHNPRPEYPRLSRQRAEQGKVVINVFIGTDGTAQKAEIKNSSGFERLDQAALATAKAWRYVPGKRGGVPEAMWFSVPINFVLE